MLSEVLYEHVKNVWDAIIKHPFIQEIRNGVLPLEKFRHYMLQDYIYLIEYAKVYAIGVAKSPNEEIMRFFANQIYSTLNGEMDIHREYMARLEINPSEVECVQPEIYNASYTKYMLAIVYEGNVLDALVAILSCSWSYAKIGEYLAQKKAAKDNPFYGTWIKGYSCREYAITNQNIIDMVNEIGCDCTEKQIKKYKEIMMMCSRYEHEFFDMCYKI